MIVKNIVIIALMAFVSHAAHAQYAYFPTEGQITYDKTVHVQNLLKRHISTLKDGDMSRSYFEQLQSKVPETVVLKKKLSFTNTESNFQHIKEEYAPIISQLLQMGLLDYQIHSYENLKTNKYIASFDIGGSPILLQDSLLNVKWKITNEYRNIAGYDCRRANGVILDSVYVVAFYTDQIPASAGPGSIHGLPGMILGLVVPEQHFNIYASKVDFTAPVITASVGKKKDKPVTRKELYDQMKSIMGDWLSPRQFNLIMAAIYL